MTKVPLLELKGVGRRFSGGEVVQALRHIDLQIYPGEFVLILGPSGSGKSTLLSIVGGLDRPTEGTVHLDGQALHGFNENQLSLLRRAKIGFVFQFFNLLTTLTALDNVALPLRMNGVPLGEANARAQELLAQVDLADRVHHLPAELSGGEQQRVAIARALINKPRLVLADEPTGNLDSNNGRLVMNLLRRFNKEHQQTFVVVSHDHTFKQFADRIVYMDDGGIAKVEQGGALEAEAID